MRIAIVVGLAIGCNSSPPPETPPVLAPHPLVLDGFAINDRFSSVAARAPYNAACSDNAVEQGLYRATVFCTERAAMIVADDRIRAFGWIGGDYYASRIPLPVKVGDPVSRAMAVFGEQLDTREAFDLATLHVDRFEGVSVLSDHRTVVGFVFGDMPLSAASERWRVFDQLSSTTTDAK